MSEDPTGSNDGTAEPAGGGAEEETVDGLPVLAEVRPLQRVAPVVLPALGTAAAAAAATGFVAGAATFALARRYGARRIARAQRDAGLVRRPREVLPAPGSRTYLVTVRPIAKLGE